MRPQKQCHTSTLPSIFASTSLSLLLASSCLFYVSAHGREKRRATRNIARGVPRNPSCSSVPPGNRELSKYSTSTHAFARDSHDTVQRDAKMNFPRSKLRGIQIRNSFSLDRSKLRGIRPLRID